MDNIFADTVVIGGGPAGMMAAGQAAARGNNTILIERNRILGKKLLITGKGRCNVTNNTDLNGLISNVKENPRFLYSAFSAFSTADTIDFFENLGVKLKTERGNRVFPESDKSSDIANALKSLISKNNVRVTNDYVTDLIIENGQVSGIKCKNNVIKANSVILATGGASYSTTGSDGNGYNLAKQAGHSITSIKPSLVPLICSSFCTDLAGLSLRNIAIKLMDIKNNKVLYTDFGELLFTHSGMSGPVILSASSHIKDMEKDRYKIIIDLKPALDEKTLDNRILRDFEKNLNRDFANTLYGLLPRLLVPVVIEKIGIDPLKKTNSINKEERQTLLNTLKNFEVEIFDFAPLEEAIITSGGVNVKEISSKTMESKLVKGLYFAGEIIDVDAFTGGFNLQIAFSTGYLAGNNT